MAKNCTLLAKNLAKVHSKEAVELILSNTVYSSSNSENSFKKWFGNWENPESNIIKHGYTDRYGVPTVAAVTMYYSYLRQNMDYSKGIDTGGFYISAELSVPLLDSITTLFMEEFYNRGYDINMLFDKAYDSNQVISDTINSAARDVFYRLQKKRESLPEGDNIRTQITLILASMLPSSVNNNNSVEIYRAKILEHLRNSAMMDLKANTKSQKKNASNTISTVTTIGDILTEEQIVALSIENLEDNGEDSTVFDSLIYGDSATVSFSSSTPRAIDILLSTIPQIDSNSKYVLNEMGLPQTVDTKKFRNLVINLLANIPGDINAHLKILEKNIHLSNSLIKLIERLNYNPKNPTVFKEDKTDPIYQSYQHNLRSAFVSQMTTNKDIYNLIKLWDNGEYNLDAVSNRAATRLANQWKSNYMIAYTLAKNKKQVNKALKIKLTSKSAKILLKVFGIESVDKRLYKIDRNGKNVPVGNSVLKQFLTAIRKADVTDYASLLDGSNTKVSRALTNLSKAVILISGDNVEHVHIAPNGSKYYDVGMHHYISTRIADINFWLNRANGLKVLGNKMPALFSEDSIVLQHSMLLRDMIGKKRSLIQGTIEGISPNNAYSRGKMTRELGTLELYYQRIQNIFKGKMHFIRNADRPKEIFLQRVNQKGEPIEGLLVENAAQFKPWIAEYIKMEIKQMAESIKNKATLESFGNRVNELRVFKGFAKKIGFKNDRSLLKTQLSSVTGKVFSSNKLEKVAQEFIDSFTYDLVTDQWNKMQQSGILDKKKKLIDETSGRSYLGKQPVVIPSDIWAKYRKIEKQGNTARIISNVLTMNEFIKNMEIGILFYGDLAGYVSSDNIIKRSRTFSSTKRRGNTGTANDSFNTYLAELAKYNSLEAEMVNRAGYSMHTRIDHILNSRIASITLQDPVESLETQDSAFASELEQAYVELYTRLGTKYAKRNAKRIVKSFNDTEYTDGIGVITLDGYRRLKLREGTWFRSHIELYQKIVSKTELNFKDYKSIAAIFTPLKPQYTGPLLNQKKLSVIANAKLALMPLIPGVNIPEGSQLENLNNQLLANRIDMAIMKSARKFGYGKTYSLDNLKLDPNSYVDLLDSAYMGIQVPIEEQYKSTVRASVQYRRMVLIDMVESGVLRPEFADLSDTIYKYKHMEAAALNTDVLTLLRTVLNEANIEAIVSSTGEVTLLDNTIDKDKYKRDLNTLVKALRGAALERGGANNELASISQLALINEVTSERYIKVLEQLVSLGSSSSVLSSLLRNHVFRQSRIGTSLVQVPQVGWESSTQEIILDKSTVDIETSRGVFGKNPLKFYRKAKDGRILAMQVMTGLPPNLVSYVSDRYNKGKGLTQQALDKFNVDVAMAEREYIDSGKTSDLLKLMTHVGFRTPNQARSSSEISHVIKYFMPHAGQQIIVPKQLIKKNGSDFDVDKYNLYSYSYSTKNGYIELIQPDYKKAYIQYQSMASVTNKMLTYNEFLDSNAKYSFISKVELNNLRLDTEIEIIMHPSNFAQLMMPLSDAIFTSTVNKIMALLGKSTIDLGEYLDIMKVDFNITKYNEYLSSLDNVATTANNLALHAFLQQGDIRVSEAGLGILGLSTTDGGLIKFGKTVNKDGYLISEVLSALFTGYIDVANNPWVTKVGLNAETGGIMNTMVLMGTSIERGLLIVNSPIIRMWNTEIEHEYSIPNMTKGKWLGRIKLRDKFMDELNLGKGVKKVTWKEFSNKQLADLITKYPTKQALANASKVDKELLKGLLDTYDTLRGINFQLFRVSKALSQDKGNFKSMHVLSNNQEDIEDTYLDLALSDPDKSTLISIENPVDNIPLLTTATNIKKLYIDMYGHLLLSNHPLLGPYFSSIRSSIKQNNIARGKGQLDKLMQSIYSQFSVYVYVRGSLVSNSGSLDNSYNLNRLKKGPNSVGARLLEIKSNTEDPLHNNKLIQSLKVQSPVGFKGVYTVSAELGVDSKFKDRIDADAHKLSISHPELYNDILYLSIVQSGMDSGVYNLDKNLNAQELINNKHEPIDAFLEILSLSKIKDIYPMMEEFMMLYISNNPGIFASLGKKINNISPSLVDISASLSSVNDKRGEYTLTDVEGKEFYSRGNFHSKDYSLLSLEQFSSVVPAEIGTDPIIKIMTGDSEALKNHCK